MSVPNPALAEALSNAQHTTSYRDHFEEQNKLVGARVSQDLLVLITPAYAKKRETVAAMLAHSVQFRELAMQRGHSLEAFDVIVADMAAAWKDVYAGPKSASKVVSILTKLTNTRGLR